MYIGGSLPTLVPLLATDGPSRYIVRSLVVRVLIVKSSEASGMMANIREPPSRDFVRRDRDDFVRPDDLVLLDRPDVDLSETKTLVSLSPSIKTAFSPRKAR